MKKVGKLTSPFMYDLNQISYNYLVEVINRFKRLNLIVRVLEELWMEVSDIVQEALIQTIPPKKTNTKRKNGCLRRTFKELRIEEKQKAKEKRKVTPT